MSYFFLLALCGAGDVGEPVPPKQILRLNSFDHIKVEVDAGRTSARGLQIVTVRFKMKDKRSQQVCDLKLELSTRDPMTKIHVIYPKGWGAEPSCWVNDGEGAIQAIIQRAPGPSDRSHGS